jgi:hypothetical protein
MSQSKDKKTDELKKARISSPSSRSLSKESLSELAPEDQASNASNANAKSAIPQSKHPIRWSPENEKILVEWCDIAQCYKWLNYRAHCIYSRMHAWYTIPAIILSTISGTASFAQTSIPPEYQTFAPMVIGSINIFIGILTTIQQYLKISELNEAHRVAAIAWDKYARNIRIELAKDPKERADAGLFIKYNRDEFDRLMETSPSIPQRVVDDFKRTFSGMTYTYKTLEFCKMCLRGLASCMCCKFDCLNETDDSEEEKLADGEKDGMNLEDLSMNKKKKKRSINHADILRREMFDKLNKPDICDIIISAEENRHKWYKNPELGDKNNHSDIENQIEMQVSQHYEELIQKEQEFFNQEKSTALGQIEEKERLIQKLIHEFQVANEQEKLEKQRLMEEANSEKQRLMEEANSERLRLIEESKLEKQKMMEEYNRIIEYNVNRLEQLNEESRTKIDELQAESRTQFEEWKEQNRLHSEGFNQIWNYIASFTETKGRKPLVEEMVQHFETILSEDLVQEFIVLHYTSE